MQLKSQEYYNDLYDKITVNRCRDLIKSIKDYETSKDKPGKMKVRTNIYELHVSILMVNKAFKKSKTIEKWRIEDIKKDKFIDSVKIPKTICNNCSILMVLEDKIFENGFNDKDDRILFVFKCSNCNKVSMIYNNGEEHIIIRPKCKKCDIELEKESSELDGNLHKTVYKCGKCNYKETEEFDLSIDKEEVDLDYESDRKKFCISEEEAKKIKDGIDSFYDGVNDIINGTDPKSIREKEEEKKYRPLKKIKILSHVELKAKLSKLLEKDGYTDFNLAKPEVGEDIKLYFSVFDSNGEKNTVKSNTKLRKILKDFLLKTNWELINSGKFENRLGIIKGRLKGIDNKNKLLELIEKRGRIKRLK